MPNDVKLQEGHPVDENLRPIKVGGKSTALEVSEKDVRVNNLYVNGTTTGVSASDSTKLPLAGGTMTGDITTDSDIISTDLTINDAGTITLDSHTGVFEMKKAGTKFADTYAGMILGYTDIGLNESAATYNLTTGYVVPTDEFSVSFVAPPSGNVEIFIQIGLDLGSGNSGDLFAGLSTANATSGYSALEPYHEIELFDGMSRGALRTIRHSWTLTGLTAGTSYTRWIGFKSTSTTGTPHLQWGSDATGGTSDAIIKAIALPATIAT